MNSKRMTKAMLMRINKAISKRKKAYQMMQEALRELRVELNVIDERLDDRAKFDEALATGIRGEVGVLELLFG